MLSDLRCHRRTAGPCATFTRSHGLVGDSGASIACATSDTDAPRHDPASVVRTVDFGHADRSLRRWTMILCTLTVSPVVATSARVRAKRASSRAPAEILLRQACPTRPDPRPCAGTPPDNS